MSDVLVNLRVHAAMEGGDDTCLEAAVDELERLYAEVDLLNAEIKHARRIPGECIGCGYHCP